MSSNIEPKVGDIWKLKTSETREFFNVFLVEEVHTYRKDNVSGRSINIGDEILPVRDETELQDRDQKITDPAEKAYWLLRFENE